MSRWAWRGMTIRLAHQGMTIRLLPQPQHKNAKAAGPAMLGAAAGVQSAQLRERCGPHRWSGSGNRKGGAESTPCLAHQFKKSYRRPSSFRLRMLASPICPSRTCPSRLLPSSRQSVLGLRLCQIGDVVEKGASGRGDSTDLRLPLVFGPVVRLDHFAEPGVIDSLIDRQRPIASFAARLRVPPVL